MIQEPKLYRKRFIPNEIIFLKDDKVLFMNEKVIVTKWNTLKPRSDFKRGYSCYFLKRGFKISKFLDKDDKLLYYYCDIIDVTYQEESDTYIFTDLLADVIVYENGFIKVVDLGEIADALEQNVITQKIAEKALRRLDHLLETLYTTGCKDLIGNYFDEGRNRI